MFEISFIFLIASSLTLFMKLLETRRTVSLGIWKAYVSATAFSSEMVLGYSPPPSEKKSERFREWNLFLTE